jgi:signal transduction histidine kinase
LARTYQDQIEGKGLTLHLELNPHLELLHSSELYVREILQNFITNAIKYTEQGQIVIGARPKQGGVEFYVSDSGIGISKADREKVFEKFFRADNSQTRTASGTGLGLYVTMKLAKLLHAHISLSSELNHGSSFAVLIPNLA